MSRAIWKHEVGFNPNVSIELTQYAKIILVEMQEDRLCFWEEHSVEWHAKYTDELVTPPMETWTFNVYGTGHQIPDHAGEYVGSTQNGPFVWHLYGRRERAAV